MSNSGSVVPPKPTGQRPQPGTPKTKRMRKVQPSSTVLAAYVRVSTDEQAQSGLGFEAQRGAIRQACTSRGWTIVATFEDAASGRSLDGRTGLAAALEAVSTGQAGGLIVAKLDRLSRSLLDFAALMERSRREGWALIALDLGVDTSTPQGELMASVLATFAQFERRLIGQRTRSALAELRAQGVRLGRPRSISQEVIDRIRALRLQGMTYRDLADHLNAEGVPTGQGGVWHAATIYRALQAREAPALLRPESADVSLQTAT